MLLKTPRSSLTALPLEAFLSFFFLNTTLYYLQTCADDVHGLIFLHECTVCGTVCVYKYAQACDFYVGDGFKITSPWFGFFVCVALK